MNQQPTSKAGLIKYEDTYLTLMNYKEPLKEVKGGFGYYGCLLSTIDGDKVQCHICGKLFAGLGMHIWQTHDTSVSDYREQFGLARKTALISEKIREEMKQRTLAWVTRMQRQHGVHWRQHYVELGKKARSKRGPTQPKIALETKNKRGVCPDQLLEKIKEVAEVLGHTPSKNEFITATGGQRFIHLIYKTFGSWTEAVKKIGLIPKDNHGNKLGRGSKKYEDEELLEYLRIFYEQTGKIPTETDCRRRLIPPSTTYTQHFGSLPLARELAGILETPSRWKAKEVKI